MNPFQLNGYHGSDTFCDREIESQKLYNAIDNERNITLTSIRKMGKFGLIKHVLDRINKNTKTYTVYYIDNYHTLRREEAKVLLVVNLLSQRR